MSCLREAEIEARSGSGVVKRRISLLLGKVLLTFSTLIWITGIAIIPLLPYDLLTRAWLAGAFIVIGEITFYASVILLGKEMVKKYGRYLKPSYWIKKRKP